MSAIMTFNPPVPWYRVTNMHSTVEIHVMQVKRMSNHYVWYAHGDGGKHEFRDNRSSRYVSYHRTFEEAKTSALQLMQDRVQLISREILRWEKELSQLMTHRLQLIRAAEIPDTGLQFKNDEGR